MKAANVCGRFSSLALLLIAAGCASTWAQTGREGTARAHDAWAALVAGDAPAAARRFDEALEAVPEDPFARFGRAAISFEAGRTETALDDVLSLLAAAGQEGASVWTRHLATAASGWLPTLLYESRSWRERLEALAAQDHSNLPWLARLEVLAALDDTARRAGREDLLRRLPASAGCPAEARLVGLAGRRPVLDLTKDGQPEGPAAAVWISGCRSHVPAGDGLAGVLVVRTFVHAPVAGTYDLALDHQGQAALRINGGTWREHGSASSWGPHRSAHRIDLTAGRHEVELRLPTYGGGAEYWLALLPATEASTPSAAPSVAAAESARALVSYPEVLGAALQGRWVAGLRAWEDLKSLRRFGPGLVQAGRFAETEPTRPENVKRDAARGLWKLAVEQDPSLVRARLALSAVESIEGRSREASSQAQAADGQAPGWWPAALAAHETLSAEGLEVMADEALDAGVGLVGGEQPAWACPILDAALRRARQREVLAQLAPLARRLNDCDARDLSAALRAYEAGDAGEAARGFARVAAFSAAPQWLVGDHAAALAAAGDVAAALDLVAKSTRRWPRDSGLRLRQANLLARAGQPQRSAEVLAQALERFPAAADLRQAARALGVALPIDRERIDGLAVISAFTQQRRRYDAPAVFVLDRLVERVFPDGTRMLLTHNIVRVQSKDALDRWGEVNVPPGAEVLTLRTVKPDLTVREPEDIFGKDSVSAPELEPGDFVEWETLETVEPSAAFGPGFVSQRFYFQSNEAPLDRSEYIVVHPDDLELHVDRRAEAPRGVKRSLGDGLAQLRFSTGHVPQIFPERAAVNPLHWLPSVRVSSGLGADVWAGFIADRLIGVARSSPAVAEVAREVLEAAGGIEAKPEARAAAIVRWVTKNIEPEGTIDEPATFALARGRGNRLAVALALSGELGLRAEPVLVRALTVDAADEPVAPEEIMSFSEVLLRFPDLRPGGQTAGAFVDLRLRDAPFGYVPPSLDGARALSLPRGEPLETRGLVADRRRVDLRVAVAADGSASIAVQERLSGGPAVEWAEALRQIGPDTDKRRRRFEEAYLAYHFPGAELQSVRFDVRSDGVRLDYRLAVERFATVTPNGLALEPRFFLSQPARRFATESNRATTLLMGPDVPLDLEATIDWPAGFAVVAAGEGLVSEPLGARGPRFVERRTVERVGGPAPARVVIRRETQVPIVRVPPERYPVVSTALRRVDAAEQAVVRVERQAASSLDRRGSR